MWESVKESERDSWREAGDMQLQTSQNVTAINTPQQLLPNQQCVCTSGSEGEMMASGFSHLKSLVSAPVLLLSCVSVDVFSWGDRGMAIPTMTDSSRLTEVSTLAYLDDRTSTSDTECGEEPDLQPRALEEPQAAGAEDTGLLDTESRGERGQLL